MVTGKENNKRDIRICIRLTQKEYEQLKRQQNQTSDQKLSEFSRKMLLGKPVRIFTRNRSLDLFMEEMILLRKELNFLGNNFNQVVRKINSLQKPEELNLWLPVSQKLQEKLLEKTETIKTRINQIAEKWWQNS